MPHHLLLIKHAMPQIDKALPASEWPLSGQGREQCIALTEHLRPYAPTRMVTSLEPKAADTGAIVARRLAIPVETMPDLHEHDRRHVGWIDDPEVFRGKVKGFFAQPADRVFGGESADETATRFIPAVTQIVAGHPQQTIAIAAHGTVISLFAARKSGVDAYPLWESLNLPALVVLALPDYKLEKVVTDAGIPPR